MSVLDDMADHLMGFGWPGAQGSPGASGVAVESPTPAPQRRFSNDGPIGKFEVDFSGTLYEGINYVRGPGSTQKLSNPPPMAKHGMVFQGVLDAHVGYVRIIRESSGLYGGLYVPWAYEGRACVRRVADETPIRPARPRTPPERGELSADVRDTWARYFAESGVSVEEVVREAWAADGDASSTTSSSSCGSESSRLE